MLLPIPLLLLVASLHAVAAAAAAAAAAVRVGVDTPTFTVSPAFVSFTMDAGETGRWHEERSAFWYNPLARALAKPLAPAYFRYGGTGEDYTEYNFPGSGSTSGHFKCAETEPGRGCMQMNATVFKALVDWSKAVGWSLIYGADLISARDADNHWDPAQFESMLRYADAQGYRLHWELGNEPDLKCKPGYVRHINCTMPEDAVVAPKQLVKDFAAMRALLRASPVQQHSLLIGPDTAGDSSYLSAFVDALPLASSSTTTSMSASQAQLLDVLTWHFYYGPGSSRPHGLNASSFSQPSTLDRFLHAATTAQTLAASPQGRDKFQDLWVGETSSTYGGGTANASAGFVAGFMWLDKLGLAANLGHKVVCRQVFAHSKYSVIGEDNLPNPDWWSSVLWRRLVGTKVLAVDDGLAHGRSLRVYAFCTAEDYFSHTQVGGVTLVVLNTAETAAELSTVDSSTGASLGRSEVYLMTSFPGVLTSRDVFLNAKVMKLADETTGTLPPLPPLKVAAGDVVSVPPKSYGFVVLPDAGAGACT